MDEGLRLRVLGDGAGVLEVDGLEVGFAFGSGVPRAPLVITTHHTLAGSAGDVWSGWPTKGTGHQSLVDGTGLPGSIVALSVPEPDTAGALAVVDPSRSDAAPPVTPERPFHQDWFMDAREYHRQVAAGELTEAAQPLGPIVGAVRDAASRARMLTSVDHAPCAVVIDCRVGPVLLTGHVDRDRWMRLVGTAPALAGVAVVVALLPTRSESAAALRRAAPNAGVFVDVGAASVRVVAGGFGAQEESPGTWVIRART